MSDKPTRASLDRPRGRGPLAEAGPDTGRPIDDPAMADQANPRWEEPTSPAPAASRQALTNPDGSPNVMPARVADVPVPRADDRTEGTRQDQAARSADADLGSDNIREGKGGGTANPSLAEGGDNG